LIETLAEQLRLELEDDDTLITPLAIGNHVDHQIVRAAAETLERPLLYYADFPYIVGNEHLIGYRMPVGARGEQQPISEQGLAQWQAAVAAYQSQLTTFWPDAATRESALHSYWSHARGLQLWRTN